MSNSVEEALIAAIKYALENDPNAPDVNAGDVVVITANNPDIGVDLDAVPVVV